jgi:hypothetical protein
VCFPYSADGPLEMKWAVFTVAFRKVMEESRSIDGTGEIHWDLKETWGKPVANGLYYVRIDIVGKEKMSKILKVIVNR